MKRSLAALRKFKAQRKTGIRDQILSQTPTETKPQEIITQYAWDIPPSWPVIGRIKCRKYTTIHNLRGRKKRRKTYVDQGNAKVTFHNITTRTYDTRVTCRHFPTTLYFKLMTFRIEWEGLHKIMDLFLQFLQSCPILSTRYKWKKTCHNLHERTSCRDSTYRVVEWKMNLISWLGTSCKLSSRTSIQVVSTRHTELWGGK